MSDHEEEAPQVEEQKEVIDDINKAIRSVIQKSQSNNGKKIMRFAWPKEARGWPWLKVGFSPDLHEDWLLN